MRHPEGYHTMLYVGKINFIRYANNEKITKKYQKFFIADLCTTNLVLSDDNALRS